MGGAPAPKPAASSKTSSRTDPVKLLRKDLDKILSDTRFSRAQLGIEVLSLDRAELITLINLLLSAGRIIVGLLLLQSGGNVVSMIWMTGITQILTALALGLGTAMLIGPRFLQWNGELARAQLGSGLTFTLMNVAVVFSRRLDVFLLEGMKGTIAVGEYAAAYRVAQVLQSLASPIFRSAYPQFVRAHNQSGDAFAVFSANALQVIYIVLLPSLGLITLGGWMLWLGFGPSFQASQNIFIVLALAVPPFFISGLLTVEAHEVVDGRATGRQLLDALKIGLGLLHPFDGCSFHTTPCLGP